MGDAFWTSANFVEQTAACALAFLKEIKRKAAAANMAAALQLEYPDGFCDRRANMLESDFRPALDAMVLKAGGIKFSDLAGTRPTRSEAESIWFQFVRAHRVQADLGIAAVVDVWERVTRDWSRDVLKNSSVRVSVPRDARLLMFAMLQHAVHDYVYPEPWMIVDPDLKRFRAAIVRGLMETCISLNGRVDSHTREKVYSELARSLSPNVVRLADGAIPFAMPTAAREPLRLNKFEQQDRSELVKMKAHTRVGTESIAKEADPVETDPIASEDPIAIEANMETDPVAAEDVETDPIAEEDVPVATEANVETDPIAAETDPIVAEEDVPVATEDVETDPIVAEEDLPDAEEDVPVATEDVETDLIVATEDVPVATEDVETDPIVVEEDVPVATEDVETDPIVVEEDVPVATEDVETDPILAETDPIAAAEDVPVATEDVETDPTVAETDPIAAAEDVPVATEDVETDPTVAETDPIAAAEDVPVATEDVETDPTVAETNPIAAAEDVPVATEDVETDPTVATVTEVRAEEPVTRTDDEIAAELDDYVEPVARTDTRRMEGGLVMDAYF
jgi:hypothetical protein